jgi:hypothetical protein
MCKKPLSFSPPRLFGCIFLEAFLFSTFLFLSVFLQGLKGGEGRFWSDMGSYMDNGKIGGLHCGVFVWCVCRDFLKKTGS